MTSHEAGSRSAPRQHSRLLGLVLLVAGVGSFITYMILDVPVAAPRLPNGQVLLFCPLAAPPLPRAQIVQYWPAALAGALVVLAVGTLTVVLTVRRWRRSPVTDLQSPDALDGQAGQRAAGRPAPLHLERVPLRVVAITGAASLTLIVAGAMQAYPLWVIALMGLVPWLPVVVAETAWKYEHYGLWAVFGVIVLLQIGHMGEHTVQVMQLLLFNGQLGQSHGVFGQLDFETVHFFWDSVIWLSLCALLTRLGRGNPWLWVAFVIASLHEVEHLYLYWMYLAHPAFYNHGGFEGIMGNGGLIGSPVARPYLHFIYNFCVVTPMVLAFWDQSKHVEDRRRSSAWGANHAAERVGAPAVANL
jgi:hypothetical protein